MKPLYRNLFLLFGLVSIGFMLYSFGTDFADWQTSLLNAGFYLPAVVGCWVVVYAFNARAYQEIVNCVSPDKRLSYLHAYKLTVSGFAFSYTTPFGFGGAPYRVMELSRYIGTPCAMSSTVLYSMMHILSHFFLWMTGVVCFVLFYTDRLDSTTIIFLAVFVLVFFVVLYFFYYGYKNGLIVKLYSILLKIPGIRKYARRFYTKNEQAMQQVDQNISYLHARPKAFYSSLVLEYVGRVCNSFEYFFILRSLGIPVDFFDALLVLAFSSLIGNLLFFFPMQLGAREGSLAAIVRILGFGNLSLGLFASFYTRIRELFWIIVGVLLVKVGNQKMQAILFDYGGTLDTNAVHWFNVLWGGFRQMKAPFSKDHFREAYVYAERKLAQVPLIQPSDDFYSLLQKKVRIEVDYLIEHCIWEATVAEQSAMVRGVADYGNAYVYRNLERVRPILKRLSQHYNLILVTNFYGNIQAVLDAYDLNFFSQIVESAVVGVRKPDPRIYSLGLEAAACVAEDVVVVGDSYEKDILPAKSLGCHTIWLKGEGWTKEERPNNGAADVIIEDITAIEHLLLSDKG